MGWQLEGRNFKGGIGVEHPNLENLLIRRAKMVVKFVSASQLTKTREHWSLTNTKKKLTNKIFSQGQPLTPTQNY